MNKRFLILSLGIILAVYITVQTSLPPLQLPGQTFGGFGHLFKRVISLDSLKIKDGYDIQPTVESDFNPVSTGWVRRLIRDFPELNWYASDYVRRTFEASQTPPSFSWSQSLYGKHYPEFDRAVLSVWCLRAFYHGSKEAWEYMVAHQPDQDKLSWSSFQEIHFELARFIDNHPWMSKEQALLTMETYLLLSDCGKTPTAQARAKEWRITSADTKEFFQKTVENCPQLYPSLKRLSYPCVELITRTAYPIHLGHLRHLEGQPSTMRKLIESHLLQQYPADFEFYYLVDLCDTAAFLGQRDVAGSLFFTESMYDTNLIVKQACESTLSLDECESYTNYLRERAEKLGLDSQNKQDRVLTRIGAMLRFNGPQYGPMLKRSFSKLNIYLQAMVLSQFDVRNFDPIKRTPNYIPAVLMNLLENPQLGSQFQDRLDKTFVLGLPFMAMVLQEHRKALTTRRSNPSTALNFNGVAKRVADNPYILNHVHFHISESNVIVVE